MEGTRNGGKKDLRLNCDVFSDLIGESSSLSDLEVFGRIIMIAHIPLGCLKDIRETWRKVERECGREAEDSVSNVRDKLSDVAAYLREYPNVHKPIAEEEEDVDTHGDVAE